MVAKKTAKKTAKKSESKPVEKSVKDTNNKTLGALCYLWIVGLIILLTEKKDKFVLFHAKQATALFVVETLAGITIVLAPVSLLFFIVAIYGLVTALQGKQTKIPLVFELGEWIAKLIKK